jgi:hypothetical protein
LTSFIKKHASRDSDLGTANQSSDGPAPGRNGKRKKGQHVDLKPKLKLVRMSDIKRKKPMWFMEGRIPLGCLTLAYGAGGIGKSTVYTEWAARASRGEDYHHTPNPHGPADVLFAIAEDPLEYVVGPKLDVAGADSSRIIVMQTVLAMDDDGNPYQVELDLIRHVPLIDDALASLNNPILLVIDPIGQFVKGDMHRDNEVRQLTGALAGLAEKHGIAVLMIGHESKDTSRNAKDKYLGSVAFRNAARSALWFTDDPDDDERRLIYHTKSNLHRLTPPLAYTLQDTEQEVPKVIWSDDSIIQNPDEIAQRKREELKKPKRVEAKRIILDVLAAGEWMLVKDLDKKASDAGVAFETLRRAKRELKEDRDNDQYIRYSKTGEDWYVKMEIREEDGGGF